MILGITDTLKPNLQSYMDWTRRVVGDVEIIVLSCTQQNGDDLRLCDGVVLTGGGDIHPKFYGREDAMPLVRNVNEDRDRFEFAVVRSAIEKSLPVLGICRGMQVCNVALGGSMIPDVQAAGYENHGRGKEATVDPRHGVRVELVTMLHSIVQCARCEVNSSHHQAVNTLGHGLRATSFSRDGLVESLEWEQPIGRQFLQLVQWHPERMSDFENPMSGGLLAFFIREMQASSKIQVSS